MKTVVKTSYELCDNGTIFVVTATVLVDADDNEVSGSVHRCPYEKDSDVSKAGDKMLTALSEVFWQ